MYWVRRMEMVMAGFATLVAGLLACTPVHSSAIGGTTLPATTVAPSSALKAPETMEPTLNDLGFAPTDLTGDSALQASLEKRATRLKIHQILALLTAIPMVATYILGDEVEDGGEDVEDGYPAPTTPGRYDPDAHIALGITTAVMYGTTAGFALSAPKPAGVKNTGSTRIHRYLAFIHGPLMVITPILGAIINDRRRRGKSVDELKDWHEATATGLLASYGAAMSIMFVNF